jgi:hypothetical protein
MFVREEMVERPATEAGGQGRPGGWQQKAKNWAQIANNWAQTANFFTEHEVTL